MSTINAAELVASIESNVDEIAAVQKLWRSLLPIETPNARQIYLWLTMAQLPDIRFAFCETASRCLRMNDEMSADHAVRFCTSVLKNRLEQREFAAQNTAQQTTG